MTRLGIVGHSAEKFSPVTERVARNIIAGLMDQYRAKVVISGRSPMGGVDVWAEEIADQRGLHTEIYCPTRHRWDGPGGFKERNLRIARQSDVVAVVVVREFPPGFSGKAYPYCYHCRDRNPPHIKSGGCWTAWRAVKRHWEII